MTYWRLASGSLTRAELEADSTNIIDQFPAQSGDSTSRFWVAGIDESDRVVPYAKLVRDVNGRKWRQGGTSGKLIIGGMTPRMFKYFTDRFFASGAHSGQFTIMVYNRGTNDWECYQCYINLPEYEEMEMEGGGYNKVALEWYKGVIQTDSGAAFSSGFSSGFE